MNTTPEAMAADILAGFRTRFEWALDDLRALVAGAPIIAEGWGLRPDLVAPIIDSPRRMVVMVPSEEFRELQARTLTRAGTFFHPVSDPARAQQNRIARDRLVAEDAVRSATRLDIPVITVDGTRDAQAIADVVAQHFQPYLKPASPANRPASPNHIPRSPRPTAGDGSAFAEGTATERRGSDS